jgi:formylglycine-generating enzyme required for sulfatase activity
MPGKIFISYRRDDVPGDARGVRDALAARFGKASIFMDVDNLLAGQRFDEELAKALASCDVFLAIIGPRWMDLLATKTASGERDYVREEIAEALNRKIVVIPVRVGREGSMPALPRLDELPENIVDLVHYQKQDVAHERFGRDAAELVAAIIAVRRTREPKKAALPQVPWGWIGATAASVLAIGWVGAHEMGVPLWWPFAGDTRSIHEPSKDLAAAAKKTMEKISHAGAVKRFKELTGLERPAKEEEARERDPIAALTPGSGKSARDLLADKSPCPFCPEMVVVPGGSFTMGSPASEPKRSSGEEQVKVSIAAPFATGKYAVTFDEWDACVSDGGCISSYNAKDRGWGRGKRPVIDVNWDDAKAYTAWLSRKTGKIYRLLSEAEREYVTRAGTTTPFWWGSSITPKQANYDGSAEPYMGGGFKGEYRKATVPVDSFEPNPWGLYNVHGNVWEWTEDCWNDGNTANPGDGRARPTGDCMRRVVRGGSWNNYPMFLRSAWREGWLAGIRNSFMGFRVARTLAP